MSSATGTSGDNAKRELQTKVDIFKDVTHQLNNYNEIFNLNMYLKNLGTSENSRLTKINETLKSKILSLKQEYMTLDRNINFMALRNNLVYISFVVICFILIIVSMYTKKPQALDLRMTLIIIGVIAVLYVVFCIILVRSNSNRRNLLWDQYYWPAIKSK
jgi:hypothetical protein